MNIFGNLSTIKACYELLPGGIDPQKGASETARKMGAGRGISDNLGSNPGATLGATTPCGRYDSLEISSDYLSKKGGKDGNYTDFPVKSCDISKSFENIDTQMITPEKLAKAYQKANKSLVDTQMELLDNTVAGFKGTNIYNRPADK
jgi:hypothetical protein